MLTVDEQLEQALARVKSLESDAEAQDVLLSEAQEQVITLQAQLTEANADRERLQADLDAAKGFETQVTTLTNRITELEVKEQDLEKRASARAAEIVASTGSTEPAPEADLVPGAERPDGLIRRSGHSVATKPGAKSAPALSGWGHFARQLCCSSVADTYQLPHRAALPNKMAPNAGRSCLLTKPQMPMSNRAVIVDDAYFSNLLADDVVKKSPVERVAEAGIVEAVIRRLAGFDVYSSLLIPENGEDLVGFACHPNGLAVAMRYLVPVARYDEAGAVTHPETGLTFGYLRYTESEAGLALNSNRIYVTVECLYGFNAAIGAGIKRITKPAA